MAKIVASEEAPNDVLVYSLGNEQFELKVGGSFETTNRDTLSNAKAHPWLEVEEDEALVTPADDDSIYAPEKDSLSAVNSVAFDPEEIAKERAEAAEDRGAQTIPEQAPVVPTEDDFNFTTEDDE